MKRHIMHVELDLNHLGNGSVVLDGHDITNNCRAVRVDSALGTATVVTIELTAVRVNGTHQDQNEEV